MNCTCDIRYLMSFGCSCGGFQQEQQASIRVGQKWYLNANPHISYEVSYIALIDKFHLELKYHRTDLESGEVVLNATKVINIQDFLDRYTQMRRVTC